MSTHSLVIRGGSVVDGTGQAQTGGPDGGRSVIDVGRPEVVVA